MQQDVIDEQTLRNTLRQLKVRDLSTLCGMVYVAKTGRKDLLICRIVDQYKVCSQPSPTQRDAPLSLLTWRAW